MTGNGDGKGKVKLERKEMNFQDLKKADSRRCSSIILIYCFIVQSANIKTEVTGKDMVCVSGVDGCVGYGGSWGTGARWMLSLPFSCCPSRSVTDPPASGCLL